MADARCHNRPAHALSTRIIAASTLAHVMLVAPLMMARRPSRPPEPVPVSVEFRPVSAPVMPAAAGTPDLARENEQALATAPEPVIGATPSPPPLAVSPAPDPANTVSAPDPADQSIPPAAIPITSAAVLPTLPPLPEPSSSKQVVHLPVRSAPPRRVESRPPPASIAARDAPEPNTRNPVSPSAAPAEPPQPISARERSAPPDPSWQRKLAAWLAEHKRYPDAARAKGQQGAVGVAFTVARDGRVAAVRIDKASGVAALDRSVIEMLEDKHVPPFSDGMTEAQTSVRVTIRFELEE